MQNAEPSCQSKPVPSAKRRRGRGLFLFLSLSLNIGLIVFFALRFHQLRSNRFATTASLESTASVNENSLGADAKRVALRSGTASRWKQLESPDLAVYAANLRAADCPPKTIRDILLPLLEEKFEHSQSSLSDTTTFWASFSQRRAAAIALAEQESALDRQKEEEFKEILGFAWTAEGLHRAHSVEAAGEFGFLDYESAEKLLCIEDRFRKQFSRVDQSHRSDRRALTYEAWRQEAGAVLSPSELEEAELREVLMICERSNPNLVNVGLTGPELRQLMAFRRDRCNPLPSAFLAPSEIQLQELDWADEQQFNVKARSFLGDTRFLAYLKTADSSVERTIVSLEKEALPSSLALQMFDLRQDAMARAQQIREMPIRRAEKRAQLAALRKSALDELATLPNAEAESPLLEANRDWLQEIAKP